MSPHLSRSRGRIPHAQLWGSNPTRVPLAIGTLIPTKKPAALATGYQFTNYQTKFSCKNKLLFRMQFAKRASCSHTCPGGQCQGCNCSRTIKTEVVFTQLLILPHPSLDRLMRMLVLLHRVQQFFGVRFTIQRFAMLAEDKSLHHRMVNGRQQRDVIIAKV